MDGFDLNQVSEANRLKILSLIRDRARVSRTELSRLTGLSLPAVSRIVGLLLDQGYVREKGFGESSGGRKPMMLETIPEAGLVIGIDLGATRVLAAAADLHGRLLHVAEAQSSEAPVLDSLRAAIHEAIDRLTIDQRGRLLGIGVGTPGLIDSSSGVVITAANLGWKNVPLRDLLQKEFDVPVFVENDANVAALAEWSHGAGRGASHLVYLTVSRGLGAGIIINGQIYRGARGTAGEIGDTFLHESRETPGTWLTLEDLCSGRALFAQAKAALEGGERSTLRGAFGQQSEPLNLTAILEAARHGDALAVSLVRRAAGYLGVGIANVVNSLDPQRVIVGGALAQAGDLVFGPIRETLDRLLSPVLRANIEVAPGTLGERAGVIGAFSLVLHHAFSPPLQHGEAVAHESLTNRKRHVPRGGVHGFDTLRR